MHGIKYYNTPYTHRVQLKLLFYKDTLNELSTIKNKDSKTLCIHYNMGRSRYSKYICLHYHPHLPGSRLYGPTLVEWV